MNAFRRAALLWLALSPALPALAQPAGLGPDLDSQDPVEWAVRKLRETPGGPKLRLWEPKEPGRQPPRNPDGTLVDPQGEFPDRELNVELLERVRALLALDRQAPVERRREAFSAVAAAAERWARSWTGEPPARLKRREAKAWVVDLQSRMINNPAVPKFHEFIDKRMDPAVAAEVGFSRGWKTRGGKTAWRVGPGDTSSLSVTYNAERQGSLDFELTRLHEWVHVVDEARLQEVDDAGKRVNSPPETEFCLFTEAKAYAVDFLLQRSLLAGDETNLQILADERGQELRDVTFEDYLAAELGGGGVYPWATGLTPSDLKTRLLERVISAWSEVKDALRALRGHEIRYLRTVSP